VGGAAFSWSLTNGLHYPLNYAFCFNLQAVIAALCVVLALLLRREQVNVPYVVPVDELPSETAIEPPMKEA
jgi:hypothetical protein